MKHPHTTVTSDTNDTSPQNKFIPFKLYKFLNCLQSRQILDAARLFLSLWLSFIICCVFSGSSFHPWYSSSLVCWIQGPPPSCHLVHPLSCEMAPAAQTLDHCLTNDWPVMGVSIKTNVVVIGSEVATNNWPLQRQMPAVSASDRCPGPDNQPCIYSLQQKVQTQHQIMLSTNLMNMNAWQNTKYFF